MKRYIPFAGAAGVAAVALAFAVQPERFSLEDPKGVNAIGIRMDSRFEPQLGTATGIDGYLVFNPDAPENTMGQVEIDASTISMTNPTMTDHMHGEDWLNIEEHPTVSFEVREVMDVERAMDAEDPTWTGNVLGELTIKGITREVMAPARLTYFEEGLASRNRGTEGDLIIIESDLVIDRTEFGIQPDNYLDMVAPDVKLDIALSAFNPSEEQGDGEYTLN
jgi:polyisoprenoid-binding protein YceI